MKYCPYCGIGLDDDMLFCPKCGKKYKSAVQSVETEGKIVENISESEAVKEKAEDITTTADEELKTDETPFKDVKIIEEPLKKTGKSKIIFGIIAVVAVLAAAIWLIVSNRISEEGEDRSTDIEDNSAESEPISESIENVDINALANSVLFLEVYDKYDNLKSTASGFVVEDGNTLVTNYHVIDGAYRIIAKAADGASSVDVNTVIIYDEKADIAILCCDNPIGVKPLLLADSDCVIQGDRVYAIGYPLGVANTLSEGVISSRYIDQNDIDVLQTTAAISNGSSGGALINESGEVVGVICAFYVGGQNMNLAVSSNTVSKLLNENSEPQKLSVLCEKLGRFGVTAENLVGGCCATEDENYYYYVCPTSLHGKPTVQKIFKQTGAESKEYPCGEMINCYKGNLYLYDPSQKDIIKHNISTKNNDKLNIIPTDTYESPLEPNTYLDCAKPIAMLVADDKIFVSIRYMNASDLTYLFFVTDLSGNEVYYSSKLERGTFVYYDDCIYASVKGNKELLKLSIYTLEETKISVPFMANIQGIDSNGRIFLFESQGRESGLYCYDIVKDESYLFKTNHINTFSSIAVLSNHVYLCTEEYGKFVLYRLTEYEDEKLLTFDGAQFISLEFDDWSCFYNGKIMIINSQSITTIDPETHEFSQRLFA